MYRVIIVDDELWSVIGLKKIIQEDAERFELVYETTDPVDAFEQICIQRPDAVFTDIRMPEMSGIELMHKVNGQEIKTEFVVISGFADFSYVQQALQAGAMDYQLKPYDRNSVKAMLDKLYTKLEKMAKLSDIEFYSYLRDKAENVSALLRQRFKRELYKYIQVVFVHYNNAEYKKINFQTGADSQSMFLKIGPRKLVCIVNSNEDKTDVICQELEALDSQIERAALSRVSGNVESFEKLLKETEVTIRNSFVYPDQKIFVYKEPERLLISHLEEIVTSLYYNKKYLQISEMITNLGDWFIKNNLGVEDAAYLWNRIVLYSVKWQEYFENTLEYMDVFDLTEKFTEIGEMSAFLNMRYMHDKEDSCTVNDKFYEMLRYIDKNYAEPFLLRDLCNMFYINMSYCCELFQKHKNMTFTQYLTDIRIRNACDFLKYHKVSVAQACEKVGYKDYFYFNKVFKKKMGCTPAEYRKGEFTDGEGNARC